MFDSRTKELVRRFLYTYDAMGNRSKPVCITLVKSTCLLYTSTRAAVQEGEPLQQDEGEEESEVFIMTLFYRVCLLYTSRCV